MLNVRCRRGAAAAAVAVASLTAIMSTPVRAQELVPHLAVYEVITGRAPAGANPPEIQGTYVFRLQGECDGGLKFEQRLRFEAKAPGGQTTVDQTSTGAESADGKRYRFTHRTTVDNKTEPEVRGEVTPGAGEESQVSFSQPAGRTVTIPADTMFPISILRRTVKAAQAGETGFEGRFFMGDKPEPPQAVSFLLGKPPRRVAELEPPQGERGLLEGRERFYFRASFYEDDSKSTGEPKHELSSVTLDNGVEIWGTHEQGELRIEYRLIRIESLPKPQC